MAAKVTSVFLYVDDVLKSLEFYNEIVGAEVAQIHAEQRGGADQPGDPPDRRLHA